MTLDIEELLELEKSSGAQVDKQNDTKPCPPSYVIPQCRKYACPPSKVIADKGTYRVVYFSPAAYAKMRLEGEPLVPAFFNLYKHLRAYFTGMNEDDIRMPMTAPVILRNDPGDDMFSPKNFTLFFYIDPKVKTLPKPLNERIQVLEVNSYTLYIRTFSSFPVTYADWMRELLQLAADVEADGLPYRKEFYYFASYDDPTHTTGRINEVQLLKAT